MAEPSPPTPTPFDDVLVEALVRHELDGQAGVDAVLAAHPQHREAVHAHLERLRQLGLLVPPAAAGDLPAAAPPSIAGPFPERFGDFQLLRRLGGGGMGVVFLARQRSLGRTVALKLVRADHLLLPGTRARFRREVDTIARLQHPGIVPVFAAGEEHGMPWLAMEHVLGASLAEVLERVRGRDPALLRGSDLHAAVIAITTARQPEVPRPSDTIAALFAGTWVSTCLRLARAIALALQHAHERGVLHRDVKPSNVMLTPDGRALLLDFGLATAEDQERLTGTGNQLGTPAYMSPEQMRGSRSLDGRTDVYSLGVLLYELITLRIPFAGATTMAIQEQVLDGRAAPLRTFHRAAAPDVALVVHKAIDPDRTQRYGDVAAFAVDLDNLIDLRPISASPPSALRIVRRWAQRHPARATAAVAAVLLFLVVPTVFLLQQQAANRDIGAALQVARDQELEARRSRDAARSQRDLAREAVDMMLTRVADEELLDVPRLQQVRADLLGSARDFYERFLADGAADPELLEQAAMAALRVAFVESGLGRVGEATRAAARAADLAGQLCSREPGSAAAHTLLANAQLTHGRALLQQAQSDQAGSALAAARQHATSALELQPDHAPALTHLLGCERSLAMWRGLDGNAAAASAHWQATVTLWQRHGTALLGTSHAAAAIDHVLGAGVDETTRRIDASDQPGASAAAITLQSILDALADRTLPSSARLALARLAVLRSNLAAGGGDVVGQEQQLRACLQLCDDLLDHNPDHAGTLRIQAMATNALGMLLQSDTTRSPEAMAELERAVATLRRLIALDESVVDNRANLAATLVNLGAGRRARAQGATARAHFEEAVALAQQCHEAGPMRPDWTNYLFQALWFLGLCAGELADPKAQAAAARRIAALQPASADTQFVAAELLAAAAAVEPDRREQLEQEAMRALQRAAELGSRETVALQRGDGFAALRQRPEFGAVRRQVEANAAGK